MKGPLQTEDRVSASPDDTLNPSLEPLILQVQGLLPTATKSRPAGFPPGGRALARLGFRRNIFGDHHICRNGHRPTALHDHVGCEGTLMN